MMIASGDGRFTTVTHPGYDVRYDSFGKTDAPVGPRYARLLNSHIACITDGLRYNYSVGKVFEIPATGSLLLLNSEMEPTMRGLGFAPGTHYLSYNAKSLDAVVNWVLDARNRAAVDQLRAQGQQLVWARHMVTHRAAVIHAAAVSVTDRRVRLEDFRLSG